MWGWFRLGALVEPWDLRDHVSCLLRAIGGPKRGLGKKDGFTVWKSGSRVLRGQDSRPWGSGVAWLRAGHPRALRRTRSFPVQFWT